MELVKLHDRLFSLYINKDQIQIAIKNIAMKMNADFKNEIPVFIGVLNGSLMVVSDLMKQYEGDCEVDFVKLSSYQGTETTHKVKQLFGLNIDLSGRLVVVVEDIIDTGNTIVELKNILDQIDVKTLKIATLFLKPEVYNKNITIDYVGMEIPNKFIVGFGLDYDGFGRNLEHVYQIVE